MRDITVNLSSIVLSDSDVSLLNRGLSFVPNPVKLPSEEILIAKNKITRNLKLKSFFMKKDALTGPKSEK